MTSLDWVNPPIKYLNLGTGAAATLGDLLAMLGDSVQARIETMMCRTFGVEDYVEVRVGNGKSVLYLEHDPVRTLTSVVMDNVPVTSGLSTVYPIPRCVIHGNSAAIRLTDGSTFEGQVIVTYSAGLAEDGVPPADLVGAGVLWIAQLFKDRDRAGISTVTAGGQTMTVDRKVPPFVADAIAQHRRLVLPC